MTEATDMPYFEGDFWPNILEECIKELEQEEVEKRKRAEEEAAQDTDDLEADPTDRMEVTRVELLFDRPLSIILFHNFLNIILLLYNIILHLEWQLLILFSVSKVIHVILFLLFCMILFKFFSTFVFEQYEVFVIIFVVFVCFCLSLNDISRRLLLSLLYFRLLHWLERRRGKKAAIRKKKNSKSKKPVNRKNKAGMLHGGNDLIAKLLSTMEKHKEVN